MNARQNNLLRSILTKPYYTPIEVFSESLQCSKKTVHSDIKVINDFLRSKGLNARIQAKRGSGVLIEYDESEKPVLDSLLLMNVVNTQAELDRFFRGLLFIVCSAPPACTMETLTHELFSNRRQLQTDIKHWNHMLSFFSLAIRNRGGRIIIEGDEFLIRVCLIHFLYSIALHYQKKEIVPTVIGNDLLFAQKIIGMIERSLNTQYSTNSRNSIVFYLGLMIKRIRNGHMLKNLQDFSGNTDDFHAVHHALEKHLGTPVSDAEIKVISLIQWFSTSSTVAADSPSSQFIEKATVLTGIITTSLEKRFGKAVPSDTKQPLTRLLESALARADLRAPIAIPDTLPMKYYSMDWFMTFMKVMYDTPELHHVLLYGTDYTRIAMLLFDYFEEVQQCKSYRAALVVNCGFEQVRFGRYKIESRIPSILVVETVSEDELQDASLLASKMNTVDFFISFEPLDIKAPVCCISHSVNEGDIAELATFIQYYQIKQIDTMTLVSPVNCILDTNALQDSIAAIHQEAKSQDIIDISLSDFTKAFSIQNAVVNDTIIVPFLMKGIKRTSLRFYTTPNLWLIQPIATIAVLFVAEHDEAVLPAIVSQFKKYIEPHLSNTPAYSLPPLQFD